MGKVAGCQLRQNVRGESAGGASVYLEIGRKKCQRRNFIYAEGESPFIYRLDAKFAPPALGGYETLSKYRYPQELFWR